MTSVMFIPGMGVRGAGIDDYFAKLSAHLNRMRPGYTLHACRWGDAVGANLLAGGISVPGAELDYPRLETATSESLANAATRMEPAFGSLLVQALAQRKSTTAQALADQDGVVHDPRQLHVQLWELLDSDPLLELEALSHRHQDGTLPGTSPEPGTGSGRGESRDPGDLARLLGAGLEPDTELSRSLRDAGLESTALAAATELVASDSFSRFGRAALSAAEHAQGLARAFTALALRHRDGQLGSYAAVDGEHRRAIEGQAAAVLLARELAEHSESTVTSALLGLVLGFATRWAAKRRVQLTREAAPAVGDVLKYLARGEDLRQFIRRQILDIGDQDLIIIAHSLGAVAVMDLLLGEPLPQVKQLIAVGSASGLLFELDALPAGRFAPGYRLPADFPPTHFVYDDRDFLAYRSAGLFGAKASDHQVDNGVAFPRSHGAYFNNDQFYALLQDLFPLTGLRD